jgi:DNA-binding CsgD family transcriptional regulator
LFLSEHTVLGYVKHVLLKLGAHSRLQAVVIGLREGLIEMPQGDQAPR